MSIDEILEEMDELLDKAGSVPFVSHKKVIDGERMVARTGAPPLSA